jgi:hypothetical protein
VLNSEGHPLTFEYKVAAGKISGTGASVLWDLGNVASGRYNGEVIVKDRGEVRGSDVITVTLAECGTCDPPPPPCPTITVSCPSGVNDSNHFVFSVHIEGEAKARPYKEPTFWWKLSAGKIIKGQNTREIEVDNQDFPDESVTATAEVGGFDPACMTAASCTTNIKESHP